MDIDKQATIGRILMFVLIIALLNWRSCVCRMLEIPLPQDDESDMQPTAP